MNRLAVVLVTCVLLFSIVLIGVGPTATAFMGGITPTVAVYLPLLQKDATPTPAPTPTPTHTPISTPTSTPTATNTALPANVQIIFIDPGSGSSLDEYVQIQNQGGSPALMTNWTVSDVAAHIYTFPAFTLGVGASVNVWTKCGANTATDLYQCSGNSIWNNDGDTATLRDNNGTVVDVYTY